MIYYAQTMPGIEEIAWLEIRNRFPKNRLIRNLFAREQNGIAVFEHTGKLSELLTLRTTEDIFMQASFEGDMARTHRDLARITELVSKSEEVGRVVNDFLRWRKFSSPPSYRVIGRQYGKFGYGRRDLITSVLRGLKQRYPRWTPVADDSQVEVWANLLGSQFLLGLRLTDRGMRHRFERRVELPASLRPSVAAAMVLLTEPADDDVFMDPMAGSGTILWERAHAGRYGRILGGDIEQERVEAARKNVRDRRGDRLPDLDIRQWDARQLPLEDNSVDKVATNLPFGKQLTGGGGPQRLYPQVLAELARVVRPGGRIVLLSSEYELVKEQVRTLPNLTITTGYSIAVLGQWGRIYIIDIA